jgi:hypothetical protein
MLWAASRPGALARPGRLGRWGRGLLDGTRGLRRPGVARVRAWILRRRGIRLRRVFRLGAAAGAAMSAVTWRNLSVPQRKALRQLDQVKTATAGWRGEVSTRLARNLVQLGIAALAPGSRADCRSSWWPSDTKIQITAAGRAALPPAGAGPGHKVPRTAAVPPAGESAARAAVTRSTKVPRKARAGR